MTDCTCSAPLADPPVPGRLLEVIRCRLEELIPLAERVENLHWDEPGCPIGLSLALSDLWVDISALASGVQYAAETGATAPVQSAEARRRRQMRLDALTVLTNGLHVPEDVCGGWRRLYEGLGTLIDDLGICGEQGEAALARA